MLMKFALYTNEDEVNCLLSGTSIIATDDIPMQGRWTAMRKRAELLAEIMLGKNSIKTHVEPYTWEFENDEAELIVSLS